MSSENVEENGNGSQVIGTVKKFENFLISFLKFSEYKFS